MSLWELIAFAAQATVLTVGMVVLARPRDTLTSDALLLLATIGWSMSLWWPMVRFFMDTVLSLGSGGQADFSMGQVGQCLWIYLAVGTATALAARARRRTVAA